MGSASTCVEVFCEDVAHERFLDTLVRRLGAEEGIGIVSRLRCARGGHGRVLEELTAFLRASQTSPELLVVAIDANCNRWNPARRAIEDVIDRSRFPRHVVACPDPHIERWLLADPTSLHRVLGAKANPGRRKCARDHYKNVLRRALNAAGHRVTLDGAEFAAEIVASMDLFRAGKAEPSLGHCIDDLRQTLREAAR
ncbi:MAG: DUF4276 family protein [Deltaproteobacteria bacterium]|nr:DUF4276 family protein [Deltaproteobacteria bacterium]